MAEKPKEKPKETKEEKKEEKTEEKPKEETKVDDRKELNLSRISVIIHVIIGVVAGWASYHTVDALYGIGIMIVFLMISGYVSEKVVNKKGIKWWLANGGAIFVLIWLISWIYFLNMV